MIIPPNTIGIKYTFLLTVLLMVISACNNTDSEPDPGVFQLLTVSANEQTLRPDRVNRAIINDAEFILEFTAPVDTKTVQEGIQLFREEDNIPLQFTFQDAAQTVIAKPQSVLGYLDAYTLTLSSQLISSEGAEYIGADYELETANGQLNVISTSVNEQMLTPQERVRDISYQQASVSIQFDHPLDPTNYQSHFSVVPQVSFEISLSPDQTIVTLTNTENLDYYTFYTILISSGLSDQNGFDFDAYQATFQTGLNPEPKFPSISDVELLTRIQQQTFRYFWDFGHPVSGLTRERNTSGETVTIGGSGFGLMAILVGIERGFITREEGVSRLTRIINFLANDADRFHGVWSHWLHGSTGRAQPFSEKDDGADLVETAFMAQGLITVRQYLDGEAESEAALVQTINTLLDEIEWTWFQRDNQDVLYWHWSPNFGWDMNMQISGYNEALMVYVLAASSSTYKINASVYHNGWARSGNIRNGKVFYGIELPLGFDFGGPLFFAHYSFLGLNPSGLSDSYANYWTQNRNHSLINRQHNIENPGGYIGYSADSWGLTASDNPFGYLAHEPTRDNGTITPTAAISSIPYTPEESMKAIRHFYYVLGDKLWGEYGFYDAFNPTESWWANSYLAIDQGPIIIMIENYRTGLLWNLFMSAPEVQSALQTLGFTTEN
ncbi:MAG: glucoamylase family protein [Bacteroidota bacterium]